MPQWVYIIIAVIIIVALIIIFFISYYFNKKTPVPKGCEHLLQNEENCTACSNFDCDFKIKNEEKSKEED